MKRGADELLTVQQAAAIKQVDESSIRRALYRDDLKGVLMGRQWIIQRRDLDAWIPERRGRKRKGEESADS